MPAQDPPPVSDSFHERSRKLLAFKLITKTLSRIPQTDPYLPIDNLKSNNKWSDHERKEVKISDALAHLAVVEHDVVAIATNYNSPPDLSNETPTLDIIAATTSNSEGPMKATPSTGLLEFLWNFIVARNPQKGDLLSVHPYITSPTEPNDFKNFGTLNEYVTNLAADW